MDGIEKSGRERSARGNGAEHDRHLDRPRFTVRGDPVSSGVGEVSRCGRGRGPSGASAQLAVHLDSPTPAPNDRVIYRVRNDGPQDLDSVLMYQPRTRDRITYPVMRTGDPNGWADDEAELGPLTMTQEVAVTLCCGAAGELPGFRVRVVCRAGDETWELPVALPDPRTGAVLQ